MNDIPFAPTSSSPFAEVPQGLLYCLQPFAAGQIVRVWGANPASCLPALATAAELLGLQDDDTKGAKAGGLLLCLDPDNVAQFLRLPATAAAIAVGAVVAAWSRSANPQPAPTVSHVAHYLHRALAGALLRDAQFSHSRVVALHDATGARTEDLHFWLWSAAPLQPLSPGLYVGGTVPAVAPAPIPHPAPSWPQDTRAIALADRLLAIEDRTLSLRGEILRLKAQAPQQSGGNSSYFDVPRTAYPWALAEEPTRRLGSLGSYDRRPDDFVVLEAQLGVAFMDAHGLLGDEPDFPGAVEALNRLERALQIDKVHPVVSIVIPVYGQLAYTLNCLDSLFRHKSRFTAEIIVLDDCSPDLVTEEFVPQIAGVRYHRQEKNGGFINSCNTGGAIAHGDYVLMLNSDTRVVLRWLDNIIGSFDLFPRAGLVGSKMLYPDGSLQEAGGILWRDGGAWNYGREDDPNRPQYCYARQVDYISGCSIALPTKLWRELGGFDRHYTPAYAEDADICQRVMARSLEVWFQPTSRVVHYEGKTSGTSTGGGVKAYQVINLKKLFLRWRSCFETHRRNAEAPFFEKERNVRKRILFVDAVTPTPNQDAGSVQTVLGLRCGLACGYKTHFVPEDNWLFEPDYTPELQRIGVECAYAPFDVGFENYIRRYGWLFDVILVYRIGVMHKSLPLLREFAPEARILFHLADLHYLRMQRQARLEGDSAAMEAAELLKVKELDAIRRSDCTITHSTVEAEIIAREVPEAPVTMWPLMVDLVGTRTGFDARRDICFLGGYRHPPNIDAVFFFVQEVMPLIHAVQPDMRFIVAGANPTQDLLDLASDRIVVTGMVEDLADVFDAVRVFVCPLRVGAGAKGKVMSALSYGLPIVSTTIGIEGAGLVDSEHMLVADEPAAMAEAVLRLYGDPVLWQALSDAGQVLLRENFSLGMGVRKLEEAIDKAHHHRLNIAFA